MERSALVPIIYLALVRWQWKTALHLYLEETDINLKCIVKAENKTAEIYLNLARVKKWQSKYGYFSFCHFGRKPKYSKKND